MVGEMLPDERNRVTLADEKDQYGLRVARVTYSWGDNDKALIQHALGQMQTSLEAVGATDIFRQEDDTNHLAGTARMGDDPATASSTRIAGAGTFPIFGSATARSFRRPAA